MSWVLRFMLGCLSIANLVHLVIDLELADLFGDRAHQSQRMEVTPTNRCQSGDLKRLGQSAESV